MLALIIILLILNIALLAMLFRPNATGQSVFSQIGKQQDAPREPAIEVLEMATEVMNRIDSKIDMLEKLTKDADKRIEELRAAGTQVESAGRALPAPRQPERATAAPEKSLFPERPTPKTPAIASDKRTAVLTLSKRGMSSSDIAKETGIGAGEVEFILNISRRK